MYGRRDPEDDAEAEELLEDALAALGRRHGRSGGQLGAWIGASLLPVRRHEDEIELPGLRAADAVDLARDVLAHHGRAVWVREEGSGRMVRGLIGSGAANLNPAVVDLHIRPRGRIVVHAAAKEGLIPQRTARKAVREVIESMQLAYRAAPPS